MVSSSQIFPPETLPRTLRRRKAAEDYILASLLVVVLLFGFLATSPAIEHWFVLPLFFCGILSSVDLVRWARGRLDAFDPQTVIGFLAFYGFFIAPLLHVTWDRFGAGYDLILWGDWRPWLGGMALLNAVGLVLYRLAANYFYRRTSIPVSFRQFDPDRLLPVFGIGMAVATAGLLYLYSEMGGISGIITAFESYPEQFVGKGWLLIFASPLTVITVITLTVMLTSGSDPRKKKFFYAVLLLIAAGIGHFLLLGWYGSRSATIWALFWMAGIVHYRFRKLSTQFLAVGLLVLLAFMYFYGFYKEQGRRGFEVIRDPKLWVNPRGYQRDLQGMFLGDLARADTTAYILHNLVVSPQEYDYRWGLTYAGGLAILIPTNFWADRPKFKVAAGTEAQLGKRSQWESSRVYGLNGEAMLNFGPLGIPPMFALFGAALGWYRKKYRSWDMKEARLLLAPFFTILFVIGFVGDSDVLVFGAVTQGALPVACVYLASRKQPVVEGIAAT
jgi:hypothetical protein